VATIFARRWEAVSVRFSSASDMGITPNEFQWAMAGSQLLSLEAFGFKRPLPKENAWLYDAGKDK
jgi:hypothetical protein